MATCMTIRRSSFLINRLQILGRSESFCFSKKNIYPQKDNTETTGTSTLQLNERGCHLVNRLSAGLKMSQKNQIQFLQILNHVFACFFLFLLIHVHAPFFFFGFVAALYLQFNWLCELSEPPNSSELIRIYPNY